MAGPQTHETPLAGGVSKEENQKTDGLIIGAEADADKIVATLRAQLALKGFATHAAASGGWLVSRWDRAHYCPHIVDLEAFARRVGVSHGR